MPINLRGLPKGKFVVEIVTTDAKNKRVVGRRTYRTCTLKQLAGLIRKQIAASGKAGRIRALLKRKGFARSFRAPANGSIVISWYQLPRGARLSKRARPKPVLIARGTLKRAVAGKKKTVRIKLTKAGKRLLRRSKRVKLTAHGAFRETGKKRITATKTFTLRR